MNQSVVSSFLGQQFFWVPISMSNSSLCVHVSHAISDLVGGQMVVMQVRPSLVWSWASFSNTQLLSAGMVRRRQHLPLWIVSLLSSRLEHFCLLFSVTGFQVVSVLFSENIQTYSRPKVNKGIFSLNLTWDSFSFFPPRIIFLWLILTPCMYFYGYLVVSFSNKG